MRIKKKYLQEKIVDEVEEKKMTKKIYSPQEVDKAEREGVGIEVDGTVVPTEDGGLEVTTMNEVGPGKVHTKKFDRCVKDVKKNSPDVDNPYAICQASLGAKAIKKSHQRKEDYTNESNFKPYDKLTIKSINRAIDELGRIDITGYLKYLDSPMGMSKAYIKSEDKIFKFLKTLQKYIPTYNKKFLISSYFDNIIYNETRADEDALKYLKQINIGDAFKNAPKDETEILIKGLKIFLRKIKDAAVSIEQGQYEHNWTIAVAILKMYEIYQEMENDNQLSNFTQNESSFTMTKGELLESLNVKKNRKVIKTVKIKDIKND